MGATCTVKSVNDSITLPSQQTYLSPVHFAYNYLDDATSNLIPDKVRECTVHDDSDQDRESTSSDGSDRDRESTSSSGCISLNSIRLFPMRAGLPWHTGLTCIRQSIHWKAGLEMSSNLLELFASDVTAEKAKKSNGASLAGIAAKELQIPEHERFTKFAAYLFPEANEERMRLLAATIVFIIIFDDSWEEASSDSLQVVQEDFVARLKSQREESNVHMTRLQSLITSVVVGMRREDAIVGNGGQETIDRLVEFCRHKPPQKEFSTIRQYLDYRRIDIGMEYLLACVKFSIGSSISIEDLALERIFSLISDHISIVNDLASFDKERRAYDSGKTPYLINVVHVVQKFCSFPNPSSAKAICYALQLEVEKAITDEISSLRKDDDLTHDQWNFIEALLEMAAGNVFYSIVTARYGGEKNRMRP